MKVICPILFIFSAVHLSTALGQNEKMVLGSTKITPVQIANGAYVMYLIKFQNLESDTAFSVSIRDTLDPKLDFTTVEMVDASHAYQIVRGGEVIRWFFNDIKLPGNAVNSSASKGHIMFRVKVKQGLTPGQVIRNRASIYIGQSSPISTNETAIWIDQSGASAHLPEGGLVVLPNPNSGTFQTNIPPVPEGTEQFWIVNSMGKRVNFSVLQNGSGNGSYIIMTENAPGYYVFQALTDDGVLVAPFIVVR